MTGDVLEADDADGDDDDEDVQKSDEQEKGGGKKKRRTAYPSGRREKMGVPQGGFSNNRSKVKSKTGKERSDNKQRSISKTDAASKSRWRKW